MACTLAGTFVAHSLKTAIANSEKSLHAWNSDWDGWLHSLHSTKFQYWVTFSIFRRQNQASNPHKVSHHVILIRHGQCNLSHPNEVLTELGRWHALQAGRRLQKLQLPIQEVVSSSLDRAKETAEIIRTCLPSNIVAAEDPLLNEGMPIKPDPVEYWDVEPSVRIDFYISLLTSSLCSC